MADLVDNIVFDEVIDPENYTDFDKMGRDIEQRINNIADSLMQSNERISNRYRDVAHDTNINIELERIQQEQLQKSQETEITEQMADIDADVLDDTILTYLSSRADTDPMAANELGVIYYLSGDTDLAVTNFEKAAGMDYAQAQRNLAIALEQNNSRDMERIFKLYSQAAEQEDAIALNNLGCCYLDGDGTEEDVKKAIKCFEQAAAKGDVLAKINLADCYSIGNGVRANAKKAFKLYCEAADVGNVTALKRTAECYLNGQGTPQSFRTALEYYQRAAEKGDLEAKAIAEKITEKANPERYNIVNEQLMRAEQEQSKEAAKQQKAKSADAPSL